jgi:signal transduction histidine kinase
VRLREELRAAADQTARAAGLERERLRRDLHDRLGPLLVGTGLSVEGLRRSTTADDIVSGLGEIAGQLRSASGEVRRLVDRLAPAPVLDLGLAEAVREHLLRLDGAVGGIAFDLRADELGDLPPGVPEAAYAVVLEAVNNVVRHAGARRAEVRIERSSRSLDVEVVDDGTGLPRPWTAGVGIASMRRRALELGGTFALAAGDHGGTRLRATFPVEEESWMDPGRSASSSPTTTPSSGSGCADCSRLSQGSTSSARPPTPRQPSPQPAS